MSTIVLSNAATLTQTGASLTFTPEPERTGVYTVKVVNRTTHAVIATLENANADWIDMVINDVWSAQFTMHTLDPDAYTYLAPDLLVQSEVQIWRDGRCLFWGIPVQARANLTAVTFSCVGLLWYYTRRYFGPVQNNYLSNPDFESGLTGWTGVNTTATVSATWRALGAQSVKLEQTAAADGYLYQRYTTTTTTVPVFFAVKALCHIPDAAWIEPAFEERGLYIEQQSTPGGTAIDANADPETPYSPKWEPITENTQRDYSKPIPLHTGIFIPAGVTRTIEVRLYSPGGTIYWDATALVVEESVGSLVTGEPAGTILARVHNYSQDAAQGKSDEDIGVDGAPGTYPDLVRIWQFFDNGNIFDAMRSLVDDAALEFEITWPATTAADRKLMVWPPGTKGTLKAASPLALGSTTVEDFAYDVNGTAVTTSARVLGQGDGADREVGIATDTSDLDGLVLESVASAPLESPIDSLQRLANDDLADSKAPVRVPDFTVPVEYMIGVDLGDTVPVTADYGYVQESGNRRVVKIHIDCAADKATVGVN